MGRKKKNTLNEREYEEIKKRALEPFKPKITDEEIRKHEEEIRERSLNATKEMREELNRS